VRDLAQHGFIPSFCTACYRLGRVGADFMDLAKPGEIKSHCQPNAIATCLEYLEDFASRETRGAGMDLIGKSLNSLPEGIRKRSQGMVERILLGEREVFC
jgi:2-iminoacetate synthase